jgi:polysaccharide deacetylase family protein (PEP-CTERM system associated)
MFQNKTILLTFDVEDWFQVENLRPWSPVSSWDCFELRVERNTYLILDLLDTINLNTNNNYPKKANESKPKATFFLLGWIVQRLPNLAREIDKRGHEVASHGFNHNLCYGQSYTELKNDLVNSKKMIEDIIGKPVFGYRAPSFSISESVLKTIQSCGYQYDSSFNTFDKHGRYGHIEILDYSVKGSVYQIDDDFYEIPLSNLSFYGKIIPWAGGGYFRFLPFFIFKKGVEYILKNEENYIFYAHPWEFDPHQPIVKQAKRINKFRHYINISKTAARLERLLVYFSDCRFLTCHAHIKQKWGKNGYY